MNLIVAMPYTLSRAGSGAITLHTILWAEQIGKLKKAFISSAGNVHLPLQVRKKICPYFFLQYLNVLQPNISCKLYDLMVLRAVKKGDYVYTVSGNTPFLARKCKKVGAHLILDSPTSHTLTQRDLYGEELVRLGLITCEEITNFKKNWTYRLRYNLEQYKEAEYITCPSKFVYNSFVAHNFPEEKLRLVYYGVDTSKFTPGPKNDEMFRVLFVGVNKLRKGLRYLLMAWRKFIKYATNRVELVVCGRNTLTDRHLMEPYYRGLWNVRRIEYVPDIVKLYQNSSVFVLPSLEDGTGLVVSEAMACGLPCIVSETTGFKDLVAQGGGFIVPPANSKAILEALIYLYDNPKEVKKIGQKARSIAECYSWKHYRDALTRAYGDLYS